MNEKKIIEFFQNQEVCCAIVLRKDKENLHCLSESGKEMKIREEKALFIENMTLDISEAREKLTQYAASISRQRENLSETIVLDELWDVCRDEEGSYSLSDLCELYFGVDCSTDECRAMFRRLLNDRIYFIKNKDRYTPQSPASVENTITQMKKEKERKNRYASVGQNFKNILESRASLLSPEASAFAHHLADVCVKKKESPKYRELMEIFKIADISSKNAPFEILVRSGLWDEDENLLLKEYSIEKAFAPELEECSLGLISPQRYEIAPPCYADHTDLPAITIDDETTRDFDDAISLELTGGKVRLGVHISDITSYVEKDTLLDEEAMRRGTSIYLPDLKIEMLPGILSEQVASLIEGKERRVLSFFASFDGEGNLEDYEIGRSVIRVDRRMTYDEVDRILCGDENLKVLCALSEKLMKKRLEKGSLYFPFPRVNVKVQDNKEIIIRKDNPARPSQILVSEMMILANSIAGDFCVRNNLPAIFRGQPPPDGNMPLPILGEESEHIDPAMLFHARKLLRKGTTEVNPHRHFGLGVDNYVQVTSPLRRYSDLVMHRQIKHFLDNHDQLYDREALTEIIRLTERSLEIAETIERDRRNYWILKYLERLTGRECPAIILRLFREKMLLQLSHTLYETDCVKPRDEQLSPGDAVMVIVDLVWPREGNARVSFSRKFD